MGLGIPGVNIGIVNYEQQDYLQVLFDGEVEGRLVAGRFRVEKFLGRGGMALVFLAQDLEAERKVALKVIKPNLLGKDNIVRRMEREFTSCSRLSHPNIVSLYTFGRLENNAAPFYVMEYLPHPTLKEVLENEGRFKPAKAAFFIRQMAGAFEHFHSRGIVHRDIKPANIVICDDKRLVVMDFGLARDLTGTKLTKTGTILGSPLYMSPEQIEGRKVDLRSDIYQLGIVAYEMLTGRKAFQGGNIVEVFSRVMSGRYDPPSTYVSELAGDWDDFIDDCLACERADRFSSARKVIEALDSFVNANGQSRNVASPPPESPFADASHAARAIKDKSVREKAGGANVPAEAGLRRRALSPCLLFTGLVIFAVCVFLLLPRKGGDIAYGALDMKVEASVDGFVLRWRSEEPYPSRLRLLGGQDAVVSASPECTTSHVVKVNGLDDGREYSYYIEYPDGSHSLVFKTKTLKAVFNIRRVFSRNGNWVLDLDIRPSARIEAVLTAGDTRLGGELLQKSRLRFPNVALPPDEISIVLKRGDWQRRVQVSEWLQKQVELLIIRLRRLDIPRVTRGLNEELLQSFESIAGEIDSWREKSKFGKVRGKENRRIERMAKKVEAVLKRRLQDAAVLSDYRRACELSSLVLGSALVGPRARLDFYKGLEAFIVLRIWASFQKMDISDCIPFPGLGSFTISEVGLPGKAGEISILVPGEKSVVLSKAPLGKFMGRVQAWQRTFFLDSVQDAGGAELAIVCNRFDRQAAWIRINDYPEILFACNPLVRSVGRGNTTIYRRVPLFMFHEGKNLFRISYDGLLGFIPYQSSRINIESVTLRLVE